MGEVYAAALPAALRQGRAAEPVRRETWALTDAGRALHPGAPARAPLQARIITALRSGEPALDASALRALSARWRAAVRVLIEHGWVQCLERADTDVPARPVAGPALNADQRVALDAICARGRTFHPLLLHGVTGSGKTEVYLQAAARTLARGEQVLFLVPEIGLTPQLVEQVVRRLGVAVAVVHSGLTDRQRLEAWLHARSGRAPVVLGTRSAVFAPLTRPGLIVIDEEHDSSYKQQDGFRYHARDMAILRARLENTPIVLGSATPSLESLQNARRGRFQLCELRSRAGPAAMPRIRLLDLRRLPNQDGLSPPLVEAIQERLARGEQALLFLNRRGFAPVLMCGGCHWIADCRRCDAHTTYHRGAGRIRCHHCGADTPAPAKCPACGAGDLVTVGAGTERVEHRLARIFPSARIERIDRDTTRRHGVLEEKLARIRRGEVDILVGTQMLSKGHHFPRVTLVGVLNADQGLVGSDFRCEERLVQQILQVAGRAGREEKPGLVLVQTHFPQSPALRALKDHDYRGFAVGALAERRDAGLPPATYLALLRAEATAREPVFSFLAPAAAAAQEITPPGVTVMDPVPSPMERRAGRYRGQLLVTADTRRALHDFLRP